MKSVAIVGFSEKTFPYVKYAKADEIWSLNNAFLLWDSFPRLDRLFEIHKRDWYLRREVKVTKEYEEWLRNNHEIPVVMQESELTPDVPMGVRYPYEEICEKYLKDLVRIDYDQDNKERYAPYFTSSFAFMMALAIYEGFDEINIFGIDMEVNTEYAYQKPCGEFWIGMALGLGIKVTIPEPCYLCNALVYGYDTIPYVDPPIVNDILKVYIKKSEDYLEKAIEYAEAYKLKPNDEELQDKWLEASSWAYAYQGAATAAKTLLKESDIYISRQFVEIKRGTYINSLDYFKSLYNNLRAKHDLLIEQGSPDPELWRQVLEARSNMFAHMGALQLHKQLINIMDLRPTKYELKMEIMEASKAVERENMRVIGDDLEGL